ncbi:T9SS type A sorting domain-containing protein [Fibrella sp. HMF5335]|uniref:T9SS type A sorting domain-containing protein n=1 Tax=Fibrella rubiginis TaxID=2817060 RepID=A0A939GDN4_9BACT|nr:T9SS type A sorting domain-containing protein [Fibrella rubiginis]MBO0937182.1 T9SS type A sorting domain-containing protein [Fibrella rubiginis]
MQLFTSCLRNTLHRPLLVLYLLCCACSGGFGQNLAGWPFSTNTAPTSASQATGTTSPNAAFTNAGSSSTVVSGYFACNNWPNATAPDLTKYIEFQVQPTGSYDITVNSINIILSSSSTANGPKDYAIRTSADNFATTIGTNTGGTAIANTARNFSTVVSGVARSAAAFTVRVYFYNAQQTGTDIRVSSFKILGTAQQPTLTTIPVTLSGFTTTLGVPSATKTYSVSGANLLDDLVITAPAGFEISTSAGSGFGPTLTLLQSGGTIATTTIYVRLTGAAVGTPSGNITNATTGITSNVAVSGTVQVAQPVELVSFSGQAAGNAVLLTWSTAQEQNSERFVVQRSADASEFVSVGTRQSFGTTDRQQYYSLTDESPRNGLNYYRLQQIDHDGSVVYSKPIAVRVEADSPSASLRENPTNGHAIQLRLHQMEAPQVGVHTLTGQIVAGELVRYGATEAVFNPVSPLSPGLYIITVQQGAIRQAMKVMVN